MILGIFLKRSSAVPSPTNSIVPSITFSSQVDASDRVLISVNDGDSGFHANDVVSYTGKYNKWTHFVVTLNGTSGALYLDNTKTTFTSSRSLGSAAQAFAIGSWGVTASNGGETDGFIDQVRFYNAQLSDANVTSLFEEKPETDTSTFKAVLYKGASPYVSNVGFQPDLLWVKGRDFTSNHRLFDVVRTASAGSVSSNKQTGNETSAGQRINSFEANGFIAPSENGDVNQSGQDFVAWVFKAGGDAVLNEVGDIDSQVSANATAGFSIVKYTPPGGGSVYTNTVGHGLTSAPEIIIQRMVSNTGDWYVHTSLIDGSNDWLELNSSDQKTDNAHNFAVTSTTFTDWGWNGNEMINYLFHSVSGVSKMGKYTGATSGVTENIGFQPSMVIIKNATQSDPWGIFDNKRPSGTGNRSYLYPSTFDDEDVYSGSLSGLTLTSTGFAIDNTNSHMVNENGETFLYMAFK